MSTLPVANEALADDALVDLAGRGSRDAFERLVATRLDRAYRTAFAILGNEADAFDATQDAFLSAWVNLPRLRDASRFDAWLHRVLVNACRDAVRRRRRSREIDLSIVEPTVSAAGPDSDRLTFNAAFERLTIDERSILVLHHLHEVPVAELARELRIPLGTAKWRLHRARRALENAMRAES